jgi:hypothetical protein
MSGLLDRIVDAHGVLERWREVQYLDVRLSVSAGLYKIKGHQDLCLSRFLSPMSINPHSNNNNNHFTTITGQCAYVTTEDAILPSNNFLNPDLPLVPITIKSILFSSAYSNIM